jgi:hypothetical protein
MLPARVPVSEQTNSACLDSNPQITGDNIPIYGFGLSAKAATAEYQDLSENGQFIPEMIMGGWAQT